MISSKNTATKTYKSLGNTLKKPNVKKHICSKIIRKLIKWRSQVGAEVQIDEVEYHRRKSHKKKLGVDKNWFIDSICTQTKFMVASEYVKSRGMKELK